MVEFEELTGKPIAAIDEDDVGIKDLRSLLYVALVSGGDFSGTEKEVGEIME